MAEAGCGSFRLEVGDASGRIEMKGRHGDLPALTSALLDSIAEGVALCSEDGIIIHANGAEEALFGSAPGDLVGRHLGRGEDVGDAASDFWEHVADELRRSGTWSGEWRHRRRDGTSFVTEAR